MQLFLWILRILHINFFDKCLHHYLIKDAINDGNVLGFSVEYIKTFDGEVNEYDDEYIKASVEKVRSNNEKIMELMKKVNKK